VRSGFRSAHFSGKVLHMRPGSDAPPDKPDAGGKRGFDDEWNALLGDVPPPVSEPEPAADPVTDSAAPASESAPDSAPDPGDSVSGLADELHVGRTTEPDVPLDASPQIDQERTMATMMSGSWAIATRDASAIGSQTGGSESSATQDLRESDAEMAAIMGADLERALARQRAAQTDPAAAPRGPTKPIAASVVVASEQLADAKEPDTRPRIPVSSQPRRMVASDPRRITAQTAPVELGEPSGRLSLGWAAAAGVAIAGAIWWFQRPPERDAAVRSDEGTRVASKHESRHAEDDPSKRSPRPDDRAGTPASTELAKRDEPGTAGGDGGGPIVEEKPAVVPPPIEPDRVTPATRVETPKPKPTPAPAPTPKAATAKPGGDPRTPPTGTPADIAAVFVRLPVSPADRPPVGGVGASGVHVDRVEMGASYDKTGCGGVADRFSLAATGQVNVCLRVVHPRQEETVSIVWQKNDGSTARRGKIAIKPLHAYRTRAYLLMRKEYVGAWTVRIQSADGVELASHAFTIAP
jgi:Protein of unknown function (DUF2914)